GLPAIEPALRQIEWRPRAERLAAREESPEIRAPRHEHAIRIVAAHRAEAQAQRPGCVGIGLARAALEAQPLDPVGGLPDRRVDLHFLQLREAPMDRIDGARED